MNITSTTKTLKTFFDQVAPSYVEDCAPIGADFPYLVYSLSTQEFTREGIIQVRIFSQSRSIEEVATLTDELEALIGEAGTVLDNGRGYLWLYKGIPFAQIEPTYEDNLKGMYIILRYRNV